jgi:hypothetical protein
MEQIAQDHLLTTAVSVASASSFRLTIKITRMLVNKIGFVNELEKSQHNEKQLSKLIITEMRKWI